MKMSQEERKRSVSIKNFPEECPLPSLTTEWGFINAAALGMIIRQKRIHKTLYSRGDNP